LDLSPKGAEIGVTFEFSNALLTFALFVHRWTSTTMVYASKAKVKRSEDDFIDDSEDPPPRARKKQKKVTKADELVDGKQQRSASDKQAILGEPPMPFFNLWRVSDHYIMFRWRNEHETDQEACQTRERESHDEDQACKSER
jgi:hypothetical protein